MAFDAAQLGRLREWLQAVAPAFADLHEASILKGGQSNPTFRLDTANGPLVLRMRPLQAEAWAHDIKREHRVLTALQSTKVRVPRVHAYCSDHGIVGAEFYLMEFIDGRIVDDCRLPGFTPDARRAAYLSMAEAFAELHAVDPAAIGLLDFGKPDQFIARQIKLHARNFQAYCPDGDADMAWLVEAMSSPMPR